MLGHGARISFRATNGVYASDAHLVEGGDSDYGGRDWKAGTTGIIKMLKAELERLRKQFPHLAKDIRLALTLAGGNVFDRLYKDAKDRWCAPRGGEERSQNTLRTFENTTDRAVWKCFGVFRAFIGVHPPHCSAAPLHR